MSGPELAKRLTTIRPGMKVICMSGYTDDVMVKRGVLATETQVLQKPFTPQQLLLQVRAALTQPVVKRAER